MHDRYDGTLPDPVSPRMLVLGIVLALASAALVGALAWAII